MTRKELNLAIFEGTANAVLWQPRLDTWIGHHDHHGTLPERYRGLGWLGVYDALRCAIRYTDLSVKSLERYYDPADVTSAEEQQGDRHISTITTPRGTLTTVHRVVWENGELVNRRIEKYPVHTADDLQVLTELVEREQYRPNLQAFEADAARVGERAAPTVFLNSAGFTDLIKWWAGLVEANYLLADWPDLVQAYLDACNRRDDRQLDAALQLPCRIFNLGDHATNEFTPPAILEKYLLPHWQHISQRLHGEGRFVHSHWDGNARAILPYLRASGLDAVEALTPEPQGDITLEQIKAAVGDRMVVLDLLPAIHFLEMYTTNELLDFARKAMDMFAPRLILGISDEISQVGQIEKVEAVTELVDEVCGLAE